MLNKLGTHVVFESRANLLGDGSDSGVWNIFWFDRQLETALPAHQRQRGQPQPLRRGEAPRQCLLRFDGDRPAGRRRCAWRPADLPRGHRRQRDPAVHRAVDLRTGQFVGPGRRAERREGHVPERRRPPPERHHGHAALRHRLPRCGRACSTRSPVAARSGIASGPASVPGSSPSTPTTTSAATASADARSGSPPTTRSHYTEGGHERFASTTLGLKPGEPRAGQPE